MKIRFALAAVTAGVLGLQPAFARQPEAELKKAQEQLEKLLKELKAQEAKKGEPAKPPVPPAPPKPPAVAWARVAPGGDATATLKGLAASKDPKVAALAKQLLEELHKSAPQPGKPLELHLELAKPAPGGGGVFEFKLATPPDVLKAVPAKPSGDLEFKVVPFPGGAQPETKGRVVVINEKSVAPAQGASTLKLSADGKTAALLAADGTITIFDVASGKEMMKFGGKK